MMHIIILTTLLTIIGFGAHAVEITRSWDVQTQLSSPPKNTKKRTPSGSQLNPSPQDAEQAVIPIIEGYSIDNTSLRHHPQTTEDVLTNRAGMIFYETVTYPEFWTFDIIRGKRRIPCKIYCTGETWPTLEAEQNMPMGVLRYLRSNICAAKN